MPLYTSKVEVAGFLEKLVHTFQTAWHNTPEDHSYTGTVKCRTGCQVIKKFIFANHFYVRRVKPVCILYISVYKEYLFVLKTLSMTDCMSIVHVICAWII